MGWLINVYYININKIQMGNACGCNENKDQLMQENKEGVKNVNIEKEFEDDENRNEDHYPSESFA